MTHIEHLNEISLLENIKRTWSRTGKDKHSVEYLLSEVKHFKYTFPENFSIAQKFYTRNNDVDIYIDDGIECLEDYLKSKSRNTRKFQDGLENLIGGIDFLIRRLTSEMVENPTSLDSKNRRQSP